MGAVQTSIQTSRRIRPRWVARLTRSNAFSWGISIVAHLVAFAILYPLVYSEELQPRRVIIPEARLAPVAAATPDQPPPSVRINRRPEPTAVLDDRLVAADRLPPLSIEADVLPAPLLPTDGAAALGGVGSPITASQTGPVSTFFGMAGNAYKVVYVVDLSGSLVGALQELNSEMFRSIQSLIPTQQFNIVLTFDNQVHEFRQGKLVWANGEHKRAAQEFLSRMAATMGAKPVEAMERAFAARPELIYFLSDGDHEWDTVKAGGRTSLEKRLEELNRDRSVRITVIGFEPSAGPPLTLLERLARDHGGNYRTVRVESLEKR